jgi:hypothetical protein
VNIGYPKEGLLIYRSDLKRLSYYNGVDWMQPAVQTGLLPASAETVAQNLPGLLIGQGVKNPNALLHINEPNRALSIPVVSTDQVSNPDAGLIVFDPGLKSLCVFDGICWGVAK